MLNDIETDYTKDYFGLCLVSMKLGHEKTVTYYERDRLESLLAKHLPKRDYKGTGYVWKPNNVKPRINFLNKLINNL